MSKPDNPVRQEPVYVTRAVVPEPAVYSAYLEKILDTAFLTNHGVHAQELEKRLAEHLGIPHVALTANGTLALQLCLRAAGLNGKKVVTTPFSYVATVSALLWEGCEPVFADIDEDTLCISPRTVAKACEDLRGDGAAGVLPVHIYGNACDVNGFEKFCRERGLVLVYDAAQAFGCAYEGKSLLGYGDFSVASFHATKTFHTAEGGGIFCHSRDDYDKVALLRACGHIGDRHISLGINAKMTELAAAMGLCILPMVRDEIEKQAGISRMYDELLPKDRLRRPVFRAGLDRNHAYYPVIFESEETLLRVMAALNKEKIFPRRYFYPALNTLPYLRSRQSCPVAENIAPRVLCLPLYGDLEESIVARIAAITKKSL